MCLGIPGLIVGVRDGAQLAEVDVVGVRRTVNVGLIDDPREGDWVLIHVGFAMDRIDRVEADRTLDTLRMMGSLDGDEAGALRESRIE